MARSETATPVRRPRRGATALMLTALLAFTNVPPAFAASAPAVGAIVGPVDPVPVGTAVSATSTFLDPDSATHTAMWSWGDGTTSAGVVAYAGGSGTVNGSHAYTQPGVYRLGLQVIDETGATGSAVFDYVVVYDSSGGFVTGGGWINSPPGAYPANPSLVGRANFGLVAKYQNGTSAPQGTTEFQFQAADFNFHSLDYEWLVVAGARAQYRGTGEIHGRSGTVRFFVTAIDGDLLGGDHPDLFRIKVFDAGGVIYDNQQGASDDADPVMALGGGQIVIHKSKDTKPVNQPPIANAGPDQTVTPGTAITLNGSASSDPDGDALTFAWTLMSKPAGSAAALTGSTTVTPHFTADIAGVYVIRLVVNDGSASSAPDQVSVTATAPVNHAPIAANDAYTTNEDTALTVAAPGILGNDTDADNDPLTAVLATGPAHGTLTLNANGSFTYMPSANFHDSDSFTYRASDGNGTSGIATVQIGVAAVNDAPAANDDTYSTNEDTALTVAAPGILGNDTDADGDPLNAVLLAGPAHGTLTLSATGSFTYTPNANFNGSDSFTYRASDGRATSGIATVQIGISAVNDAPVANDDAFTTNEDVVLTVNAPGVLGNDTDVDGGTLTAVLIVGPAHGTLSLSANGSLTYAPSANFNGSDSFTYRASDGSATSGVATVQIIVAAVNDVPVARDDTYSTNEDTPLTVAAPGIVGNDTDADGGALTAVLVAGPAHGTLTLNADGSLTYVPNLNFNGSDSFTYRASDGSATSGVATVQIGVGAVNDAPVANDDAATTNEDTAVVIDVLANDADVDGNLVNSSVSITLGPTHGATSVDAITGRITYTPAADYHGGDALTYQVCDTAAACDTAEVAITVVSVNDAPVANDDTFAASEDSVLTVGPPGILGNDTDADGNALAAVLVAGPAHGTLALNADGSFTYMPNLNFNGSDSFTYRASDGTAASATATVHVAVSAVNDPPDAHDDVATTNEDTPVVVNALGNDTDADNSLDPTSVSITAGASHGATAVDATTGQITYTPAANFHGSDSFTYRVCDAAAACDTAVVAVTVLPVNDAPVANAGVDQSATTAEMVTLDGSGSDADGDTLTFSWTIVSAPVGSTAVLVDPTSDSPTLTPDLGGVYVIALTVNDGVVNSAPDQMQVTVNTPPTVDAGLDQELVASETLALTASFTDPDTGDTHIASIDWGDGNSGPGLVDELTKTITGSHVYAEAGTFTVTVVVTDSHAATGSDTMTVDVAAANTAPIAVGDTYAATEDTVLTVAAPGIVGNDTDTDGNTLTAVLVSGPVHGTLDLSSNGSFTYTPALNFSGADSFTYQASDGTALSAAATVTINVVAVNDAPVATDDSATTNEDVPVLIDVLSNDADVEGGLPPSGVSVFLGPTHGQAAVDPATGAITFTPQANFHGSDSFTYQVCDPAAACDTAVVTITVLPVNDPPIADAGDDENGSTGQVVTLDGSDSFDPDGDTITYAWTIVSAPAGSTAALSAATTSAPTFTPDRNGVYRFELTVSDGTATSSDQVDVTALGAITLTPDPLNLQINSIGSMTVTLSAPAGPGGQLVDLSTNGSIVTIPSSVLVLASATSVSFDVTTGAASGSVLVTAAASGFASDSATVNIAAGTLLLTLEDELVGVGRSVDGTVTLFSPAPPGGTVVTLVITHPSIAAVTPSVTIPAGATQGAFFVTGVAVGQTTLTGTAPGYSPATADVTVTDALISIGNIPEIGPDETEGVPISLTKPAPPGGLTITLVTTDPSIATVSPTSTVAAGQFLPPTNPQVTGHTLGTTEIVASAPGFATGHRNVVVALRLTFSPTSLPLGAGTTRDITLLLSHAAPIGGLTVHLTTDHPTRATVPATVIIPQGQTSVVIPVTGVSSGTTTLRANATGIAEATATIIVGAPITVANQTIGKDLQAVVSGQLGVVAPAGNLLVTFTSSDPSLLVVSSAPTVAGGASATVQVAAGNSQIPAVYFQALAGSGTVHVIASALGYGNGDSTVTLTPSGFWIWAPGFAQSFTTNSFAANSTILVSSIRLTPALQSAGEQELRGGVSLDVDVTSSNTAVGTVGSPVAFMGGTGARKTTQFDPRGPGVSILSIPVPVPGFSIPPTLLQTVTATVVAPTVKFNGTNLAVGRDLQTPVNVFLESAPPGPVDLTVSVATDDIGSVYVTKVVGAQGASSVTFNGITNTSLLTLWVQGRAVDDTVELTASAPGYNSSTLAVSVTPSGFWIWSPGFAQSFTTNSFAADSTVLVSSIRLTTALQSAGEMEVRGGLTVKVDVTSSDTAVGAITTSPVVFVGGSGARKQTAFNPQGAGVSILSLPVPVPGFSIPPTALQTVTATVVAPLVKFFSVTQLTVGHDLQTPVNVFLESAPPGPVDVTVAVSGSGTGLVTLTKNRALEGSSSVTFNGVTGTALQTLWVQGRTLGNKEVTVSAAGYTSSKLPVTVSEAGFWTFAPGFASSFTTNTFAAPNTIFVRSAQLTSALQPGAEQELRAGVSADVKMTSSNTAVGSIVTNPVHFSGGGASTVTALFDPQLVGVTTLSLSTPDGFTTPVTSQSILATVRAPEVRFFGFNVSSNRVGRDLQIPAVVTLEDAPPEPVDVTITVAPGGEGIVSVSKVRTDEGSNTVTFAGVTTTTVGTIYIQGRALGSTQLSGVAAGYNDGTAAIAVDPSGFRMYGPGFQTAITTTAGAANITLTITTSRLDPVTLNVAADMELRGGLSGDLAVNVPVTSSNTAVGKVLTSPVVFQGGTGQSKQTLFDPIAAGVSVVSMPSPVAGFSVPSNGSATVTFTVNP